LSSNCHVEDLDTYKRTPESLQKDDSLQITLKQQLRRESHTRFSLARGLPMKEVKARGGKGKIVTVLLVIFTVALFIALDYLVRVRVAHREEAQQPAARPELAPPFQPVVAAEPVWVAGYQLPEELHYHRGHTWARVLGKDTVLVGLDDFARKLIGPAKELNLPAVGSHLDQGDKGFDVEVNGKSADFVTPVDGQVVEVNSELVQQPHLATDDPYGRGWVMKIRSSHLATSLRNLLSGSLARSWMEDTRRHLDLQLMALSGSVLQDGGEPVADFARQLSEQEWKRLIREFLLT
jgi:glycine cleavage system H protein